MQYIKPMRNLALGVLVAGAGLVASGAAINEMNKNRDSNNAKIEFFENLSNSTSDLLNSTSEGRQASKTISELLN